MNSSVRITSPIVLITSILVLYCVSGVIAQRQPRGHLVVIGGGTRGPEIMKTFVHLAGDAQSKIVIFPMASELAATSGPEQIDFLKKSGAAEVLYLNLKKEEADGQSALQSLEGVTGIFFLGGDQSRLTAALKHTKVEQRLHQLYREGAVIGGTSAGAAVMSRIMLTGDERKNKDSSNAFTFIQKDNVITAEGFGFIDNAIVDQHFIKRKRHNRLISLVLENPTLIGVGIDEATAIVVNPNQTFDVIGDATVMIIDPTRSNGITTDSHGNLSGANLRMHLLKSGDSYNLKARKPILKAGSK